MTHEVVLQDPIYSPIEEPIQSITPTKLQPQEQRSPSPGPLISSASQGESHFQKFALNHNTRSTCLSMVKKRKGVVPPDNVNFANPLMGIPKRQGQMDARRESSKIENIIRQQTLDDKLKPTSFNLQYVRNSNTSHRRLLSIPKPSKGEEPRFSTTVANSETPLILKQGISMRPPSRLPPIAKSHHKAITEQLMAIHHPPYCNRAGSSLIKQRICKDAPLAGFIKSPHQSRDIPPMCFTNEPTLQNNNYYTAEAKNQERKQILQKVAKLQMQPSGSLKNLKEMQNVDLGHVKLNVQNLKTFREKSSKSKKEEQKFKRRFPIIQIRSKIKPTLNVKTSHEANMPKFLLQQKQMSKNLAFQSPTANKIRNIIKGFSVADSGRNESREGNRRYAINTSTNPLIGSAIQTPMASKQMHLTNLESTEYISK